MAQMGSQILPARLTTDDGVKELARRPIGSGAYRFVEWVKDERLVMEANRDWWGWEGRAPAIDRVVWKAIPDDFPRLVALEKGDVDIVTSLPPDRIKSIAEGPEHARRERAVLTHRGRFRMHATQPPLADKRVRQAMHYALDVPAIIKQPVRGHRQADGRRRWPTPISATTRRSSPIPTTRARAEALLARGGVRRRDRRDAARGDGHDGQRQAAPRGRWRTCGRRWGSGRRWR